MNETQTLINANIFFFITSVSVVFLTVILIVVLVYLSQILRNVRDLTKKAKVEAELISQDISELRSNVKKEGMRLQFWWNFFSGLFAKSKSSKNRGRK